MDRGGQGELDLSELSKSMQAHTGFLSPRSPLLFLSALLGPFKPPPPSLTLVFHSPLFRGPDLLRNESSNHKSPHLRGREQWRSGGWLGEGDELSASGWEGLRERERGKREADGCFSLSWFCWSVSAAKVWMQSAPCIQPSRMRLKIYVTVHNAGAHAHTDTVSKWHTHRVAAVQVQYIMQHRQGVEVRGLTGVLDYDTWDCRCSHVCASLCMCPCLLARLCDELMKLQTCRCETSH